MSLKDGLIAPVYEKSLVPRGYLVWSPGPWGPSFQPNSAREAHAPERLWPQTPSSLMAFSDWLQLPACVWHPSTGLLVCHHSHVPSQSPWHVHPPPALAGVSSEKSLPGGLAWASLGGAACASAPPQGRFCLSPAFHAAAGVGGAVVGICAFSSSGWGA